MKRLWNHVRNFCHVSTTSLVIPSECGTLIYPIAKIQGLSVDPQPRKLWPGLPGSLPGFGKQKHHEATGSGKKKQLIPVEQSRKVWIPQLLRTSKSSTQEVYFYHLLSVFHVKDSSDWTLDTVPEGRVFALVLSSGSIQLRLCYNESDNMLQSGQIRQVEPPIWCHLISLYRLQPSLSLQAFWHTLQLPFGSPKTRAVGRSCWVSAAKNLTSRSFARALCFWSSNVCPGQLIHCSESQIPRLFPQSNWMRSC